MLIVNVIYCKNDEQIFAIFSCFTVILQEQYKNFKKFNIFTCQRLDTAIFQCYNTVNVQKAKTMSVRQNINADNTNIEKNSQGKGL